MSKGENIFKRKDGRWEARYIKGYDKNRKICYGFCYGHSYREAKEKVSVAKANWMMQQKSTHEQYEESFSEYCDRWFQENQNNWKLSTAAKYRSMLEKYIKPILGDYRVQRLDSKPIAQFSYFLQSENKLSAKTVHDILVLLHKILNDLQLQTQLVLNSFIINYPKIETKDLRILTREEQALFTTYLLQNTDIYKFSILLALTTGLRVGEICGLRWCDFSLSDRTISVMHTVQRIKNLDTSSTQKTVLQIGSPKTRQSKRTIPLTDGILSLCQFFHKKDSSTFVLTSTENFTEPRTLQRKLEKYTSDLNLVDVHFHTLRHTFATRCIEAGCDIKTLSEILGHSSVSMTMNRYVHPSLELKRENIQKLMTSGFDCVVR